VDHIAKPIDPDSMFQTLLRWLPKTAAKRGAPVASVAVETVALPAFEGLDVANALRRVGGNRKLYLSLLSQFTQKEADAAARIATAVSAKDMGTAERIAHTVKGVAANVGLLKLSALAAALETALKSGAGVKSALSAFEGELARDIASLAEALADLAEATAPSDPAREVSDAESIVHLTELAALLAASKGKAVDYLHDNSERIRPLFAPSTYPRFENAVASYEFDTALAVLRHAASERGIQLQEESK
jgi:HPt (histidine-containing phosphotransfer) domain-containing protein